MTIYSFTDDPTQQIKLYINREYNENVPPHERYTMYMIKDGQRSVVPIHHYDYETQRIFIKDGDVFDLKNMLFAGKRVYKT